uniref:Uncharacterized protein n=1 Tax=viral metagenome TaxID=1070528 RepID=A0A6C0DSM2_9ZZZZ
MVKTEDEMYDVSKYTETELFGILDLTGNPTDRELEAKILFLIKKYGTIQNDSGRKLSRFFRDIFDHFFESEEEEDGEGDEYYNDSIQITETYTNLNTSVADLIVQGSASVGNTNADAGTAGTAYTSSNGNVISGALTTANLNQTVDGNIVASQLSNIVNSLEKIPQNQNNIGLTRALDYSKDTLNPLLKQTVKRIISVDSQYREDHSTLSTDFTFNLSDPLKDVVSLKLYSIQIPYTWWTINANYGSNLIYLKGNSPGIDTGDYDISINITPGNYSPNDLVTTINNSLSLALLSQPDTSFGTTQINYNSNTSLCTFNLDIKKAYNESNYYLYFPNWTRPSEQTHNSIPSFLGFNSPVYYPFNIESAHILDLTTSNSASPTGSDYTNATYYIDNTNNYFTVLTYDGPTDYVSSTSTIDTSYQIFLSNDVVGIATRNQIVTDLSNQLATNNYLQGSSIVRTDILDPTLSDVSHSYYSLNVKLNRNTTNPRYNVKYVIIFPDETSITQNTSHKAVWTGTRSCFCFSNLINQPNNVVSEFSPVSDLSKNITFPQPLSIYLHCTNPDFINPINDYNISIPTNVQGYTYSSFISQINNSLVQVNNNTKTARNITGDFNLSTSIAYIDASSQINLQFDINKTFNQDMYMVDLSQSFLHLTMNLGQSYQDLSSTNVFQSSFNVSSSYKLTGTSLLCVTPSYMANGGNIQEAPYSVPLPNTVNSYTDSYGYYPSYQNLQNAINQQFSVFTYNGEKTLQGTNVALTYNTTNQKLDCTFTVVIQRVLTDKDYTIELIDPSATSTDDLVNSISSVWSNQLLFDASYLNTYPLTNALVGGTSYSRVTSSSITFNSINITNTNNYFYFKPIDNGVIAANNANDILIRIPNGQYKRSNIISAINSALNSSPSALTYGSQLGVIVVNNFEYTNFHIVINKIYTATDYNLVFYDPYSFVKCFSGISSIRNTTWDSTLGWTLGFRVSTVYNLSSTGATNNVTVDPVTKIVTVYGDTTVSTNLYNYFLICIDDYNLNHLNDGLVTVTMTDSDIPLPSYANRANYTCDPVTGAVVYNNAINNTTYNSLTQQQIYSLTQIANNQRNGTSAIKNNLTKSISSGPFVKDVFGIIPMKTTGLANGSVYVDFSGTLQNQERTYFGPVNIQRMSVKLVTDRGDVLDLNGSNWSFSLLCEQLYQQKPGNPNEKKSS